MSSLIDAAYSNGFLAIHTGSLTCSLKTTSGQPLPVRFHSWIFVCMVVAPLPSPSKVTTFTCWFGCALTYAWATGRRTESTQTVRLFEPWLGLVPGFDAPLLHAAITTTPVTAADASTDRRSQRDKDCGDADP